MTDIPQSQPAPPSPSEKDTYSIHPKLAGTSKVLDKLKALLLWTDPLTSGITFASGLLFVFLIKLGGYTFVTLLSYLLLLQLTVCFIFINGTKFILNLKGQLPVHTEDEFTHQYLTTTQIEKYLPTVVDTINVSINECSSIIRCRENVRTLKVCAALFVVSIIGRLFDGITLFGLVWLLSFVTPKLYLLNQDKVDAQLSRVQNKINNMATALTAKVPGLAKPKIA